VAISASLFGLVFGSCGFFGSAATPLVAAAYGQSGMTLEVKELAKRIVGVGLIVGAALCVGVEVFARPLVTAQSGGGNGALIDAAVQFARIRALSAPAVVATNALNGCVRGVGDAGSPLRAAALAAVVNVLLDVILVAMMGYGANGAAAATVAAEMVAALYLFTRLSARVALEEPQSGQTGLDGAEAPSLLAGLGPFASAAALSLARTVVLQLFLAATTTVVGGAAEPAVALAAHQILKQLYLVLSFATDAIAVAAQNLVASLPPDEDDATLVKRLVLWGVCAGVLFAVTLEVGAPWLVDATTDDLAVRAVATDVLRRVVAPLQIVSSIVFVGDGVMQGSRAFAFEAKAMAGASAFAALALFLPGRDALSPEAALDVAWHAVCVLQVGRLAAFGLFRCSKRRPKATPSAEDDLSDGLY